MPRYGPFIHQVYIADGFADDCDELIHRCLSEENLDYQVFCRIWKEMNMGCMYEGRFLGAEIAELSEEVIRVGKHYMLKDTCNFEESAIGVFIVYALLHLQPYKGFANLRLVPEDLPAINRIEHVARRDKRYDVLYALGSILIKGPVQYHATEREYGMDLPIRKYLEGFTSIDKLGVRPKGVFRRQNEELDILKELHIITQKYTQSKMKISDTAQFDRNLKYINPDFPKVLETALLKLINGIHEEKYGNVFEPQNHEDDKIVESRRTIKDRAMKQEVGPVKHLVNVRQRKTSTVTSVSPEKDGSKAKRKNKKRNKKDSASEGKVIRKRRIPISPRALKRNRINTQFKNDEESTSEDDESDATDPSDIESTSKSQEKKAVVKKKVDKEIKKDLNSADEQDVRANEQELDIQIDTLPVLIRTEEEGKLFEIKIIDNLVPANKPAEKPPLRTYKKKESAIKKINSMPGMSIEKIAGPELIEPVPSTSFANDYAVIVGPDDKHKKNKGQVVEKQILGIQGPKIEKRDCKRVHIQSKFKRLGMLPVANFEAPEDIAGVSEESDESEETDETTKKAGLAPIED